MEDEDIEVDLFSGSKLDVDGREGLWMPVSFEESAVAQKYETLVLTSSEHGEAETYEGQLGFDEVQKIRPNYGRPHIWEMNNHSNGKVSRKPGRREMKCRSQMRRFASYLPFYWRERSLLCRRTGRTDRSSPWTHPCRSQ